MQIRAYLYLMAAAILVPVILFAGFTLRLLDDGDSARARDGLARKAERIALLVDDELSDAGAALRVLAASPSLARGDLAAFHREAGLAVGGASSWAMLIGLDGEEIVNTLAPLARPGASAGSHLPAGRPAKYAPDRHRRGPGPRGRAPDHGRRPCLPHPARNATSSRPASAATISAACWRRPACRATGRSTWSTAAAS
ncbi:hypothetical protein [Massilia sp. Se16.2.3]|uniref:hypothetical protein n=1 Tax=Massilia sp. Se16.2.3 TaxID=2709303 RepID=UPI001601479F|nr:hypothetical protein G4G31_16150 [Massilia sp. Se16.2.3]